MSNYINELETQNDELKEKLAKSLKLNEEYEDRLLRRQVYDIYIFTRVNAHLIGIQWTTDFLFNDSLVACKYLRGMWNAYMEDFTKRFKKDGFEFKYFAVKGMFVHNKASSDVTYGFGDDWAFETKKELLDTIKVLKTARKK